MNNLNNPLLLEPPNQMSRDLNGIRKHLKETKEELDTAIRSLKEARRQHEDTLREFGQMRIELHRGKMELEELGNRHVYIRNEIFILLQQLEELKGMKQIEIDRLIAVSEEAVPFTEEDLVPNPEY